MERILIGPVVRIPRFHRGGPGSNPGLGTLFCLHEAMLLFLPNSAGCAKTSPDWVYALKGKWASILFSLLQRLTDSIATRGYKYKCAYKCAQPIVSPTIRTKHDDDTADAHCLFALRQE